MCSVSEVVSACDQSRGDFGVKWEARNLKQKMRVLMKLFLALALILVCPPDWHWGIVENYRWLERSWQQDNERDGMSATKSRLFVMWSHTMKTT